MQALEAGELIFSFCDHAALSQCYSSGNDIMNIGELISRLFKNMHCKLRRNDSLVLLIHLRNMYEYAVILMSVLNMQMSHVTWINKMSK